MLTSGIPSTTHTTSSELLGPPPSSRSPSDPVQLELLLPTPPPPLTNNEGNPRVTQDADNTRANESPVQATAVATPSDRSESPAAEILDVASWNMRASLKQIQEQQNADTNRAKRRGE